MRLAAALAAALAFSCLGNVPVLAAWLAAAASWALACGVFRSRAALSCLAAANVFLALIWLTVPWSVPGEAVFSAGCFTVSREGVLFALRVTLKCWTILLVFQGMTHGLLPEHLWAALCRLRLPAKLVFLCSLLHRYVGTVRGEWQRLRTAAALRGFRAKMSLHSYRTLAGMLALTLINAIDRGERVWEAMCLRGFSGDWHPLSESPDGKHDAVFAVSAGLALGLAVFCDFWL